MKWWASRPTWQKGGIIAIPVALLVIPATIYISLYFGGGDDVIQYLAPEVFALLFGLAMSAHAATLSEVALPIVIVTAIFAIKAYVVGAILGAIYGKFFKGRYPWLFWVLLVLLYCLLLGSITYYTQDLYKTYYSANTPEECTSFSRQLVSNFNVSDCYRQLAERKQDVRYCDYIQSTGAGSRSGYDSRGFCYEEVAHVKNDPSICDLIPAAMKGSAETSSRSDACYVWFHICEKIKDRGWREQCLQSKGATSTS